MSKCVICGEPATKKVIWADGRAFQPSCDEDVKATQDMLTKKNGAMTELSGVQDLSWFGLEADTIDLVSEMYPDLERKPGGPDNWVEAAGGLPKYIERIAKRLHYEKGMSISHAIATAVNTVKRWARMGKVAKYGDPNHKHVSAKTAALAAKAVAAWEAKKRAGSLALSEELLRVIDLTDVTEEFAYDLAIEFIDTTIDLADADVSDTDTMVCVMIPASIAKKIAVESGVPPEDMHVTITFNKETDEATFDRLVNDIKDWAADAPMDVTLKGQIGGIGAFPSSDSDKGIPWFVPVDVPGLNTLHEQIKAVSDRSAPAADNHGYTPHMTLTYQSEGEAPPAPVPATPVEFRSIWVVRGNTQRVEIPLKGQDGADLSEHAILSASDIDLSKGDMDIQTLAERANRIEDPEARAHVRRQILDLASTIPPRSKQGLAKDGRRSYKKQGRWRHGFIPVDRAAHESKAKGSPIAMKRTQRLFGTAKGDGDSKPKRWRKAATGRVGSRHVEGDNKRTPKEIKVDEQRTPGSERVSDISQLRNTGSLDSKSNRPVKGKATTQKEASKSSRVPERATQNWDEIPEALKTIRGGKRYVLAEFGGKQYVTEWVGGVDRVTQTDPSKMKVMRTLSSADAKKMSPAALRALMNNPRTPESVKVTIRKALREHAAQEKKS
jgi:2'-5' RNA ligase